MKLYALVFSLIFFSDANAKSIFSEIGKKLGISNYTSPMDALGVLRTGTCEAQLDVFRNAPRNTYRWMSNSTQESSDYLDAVADANPECAQKLAYQMAYVITKHGKKDRRRNNQRAQAANRSLQRFLSISGNASNADAYLTEVRSCFEAPRRENPIQTIFNDINPIALRSGRCSPVTVDKIKVVSGIQGNIQNAYGIRKNADGGYDILLNYDFRPMSSNDQTKALKANEHIPTPAEMMNRTRECFAEAKPFLKGPSGETLNFQALTPSEVSALPRGQKPPKWSINIVDNSKRGNSKAYSGRFGCPTIIHETLHVLGLCDEYQENDSTISGRCRVTSLPNTIMNRNIESYAASTNKQYQCECDSICQFSKKNPDAWRLYTGGSFLNRFNNLHTQICETKGFESWVPTNQIASTPNLKVLSVSNSSIEFEDVRMAPWMGGPSMSSAFVNKWTCSCDGSTNPDCPRALAELKEGAKNIDSLPVMGCPQGYPPISSQVVTSTPTGANDQVSGNILNRYRSATASSLLAPAHFNRIVNGLCENEETSKYVGCASWAYKDSSCSERPAICEDPQHFLGL